MKQPPLTGRKMMNRLDNIGVWILWHATGLSCVGLWAIAGVFWVRLFIEGRL